MRLSALGGEEDATGLGEVVHTECAPGNLVGLACVHSLYPTSHNTHTY
jgi:hypothetical protein